MFRGFTFSSLDDFERFAATLCPEFGNYVGGNSPRTRITGHVFTATEYPKAARISMHNEGSYLKRMPTFILFYCAKPADSGGHTPLADCRKVLNRIHPRVRSAFERHGVRYTNNMHDGIGFGRSWKDVFGTESRTEVVQRLASDNYECEWKPDGGLRTSITAPATLTHSVTGEQVWINQAEQWHPSSLDPLVRSALVSTISAGDWPHNAFFGDGSPLSEPDLADIRKAMDAEERVFVWEKNDVLLCDNMLVMHGRYPFSGERKIFVCMG